MTFIQIYNVFLQTMKIHDPNEKLCNSIDINENLINPCNVMTINENHEIR